MLGFAFPGAEDSGFRGGGLRRWGEGVSGLNGGMLGLDLGSAADPVPGLVWRGIGKVGWRG